MEDRYYAVIDTNVIVSAIISKHLESNPAKIIKAIVQERIVPLFNDEILDEYREVLSRPKFHLTQTQIDTVLKAIINLRSKHSSSPTLTGLLGIFMTIKNKPTKNYLLAGYDYYESLSKTTHL